MADNNVLFDNTDMSEEEKKLRQQLEDAWVYYDAENYEGAKIAAQTLLEDVSISDFPEVKNMVEDLINAARNEQQEKARELFSKLIEQIRSDDLKSAKQTKDLLRSVDPSSPYLEKSDQALQEQQSKRESKVEIQRLLAGLRNDKNITVLRESIHKVQTLQEQGELTGDLVEALPEAQKLYNELRARDGKITSMEGMGNLREAADAILELRKLYVDGSEVIHDDVAGKERPIIDVIKDKRESLSVDCKLYLEEAEQSITNDFLPSAPNKALISWEGERYSFIGSEKYQNAFSDKNRSQYETILIELRSMVEKQNQAKDLVNEADRSPKISAVERAKLALIAKEVFPDLVGIDEKIDEKKRSALDDIRVRAEILISNCDNLIKQNEFNKARELIDEALSDINEWDFPEGKPKELTALIEICQKRSGQIVDRESLYTKLVEKLDEIKNKLGTQETRSQGIKEYQSFLKDENYKDFHSVILRLESLANQAKEVGTLIDEVQILFSQKSDWERIADICCQIKKKNPPEKDQKKVEEIHQIASAEIDLLALQRAVTRGDMERARELYDAVLRLKPEFEKRMKDEKDLIEGSEKNNAQYAKIYQQAEDQSQSADIAELVEAFNKLRFLCGLSAKGESQFPDYHPNFFSAKARRKLNDLQEKIDKKYIAPIVMFADKELTLKQNLYSQAQKQAQIGAKLRKGGLLRNENQFSAVHKTELFFAQLHSHFAEELKEDPDAVLATWEELLTAYPHDFQVQSGYSEQLIQTAIRKANGYAISGDVEEAVKVLKEARGKPGMEKAWDLSHRLIEILIDGERFEEAKAELKRFPASKDYKEKKKILTHDLYDRENIREIVRQVKSHIEKKRYLRAFEMLKTAMEDPAVADDDELLQIKLDVSKKGVSYYRKLIEDSIRENKPAAVRYLIDLISFEKLAGGKQNPQSKKQLDVLSEDMVGLIPVMMEEIEVFESDQGVLKTIDENLRKYSSDLVALEFVFEHLLQKKGFSERIKTYSKRFDVLKQKVNKDIFVISQIKNDLAILATDTPWEYAWRNGNWEELDGKRASMRESSAIVDVRRFFDRLEQEQKLFRVLRAKISEIIENMSFERYQENTVLFKELRSINKTMPTHPSEKILRQQDFEKRKDWINNEVNDGEVVGWSLLEEENKNLYKEIEQWQKWSEEVKTFDEELKQRYSRAVDQDEMNEFPNRVARFDEWDEILSGFQELIKLVQSAEKIPERTGTGMKVKSKLVKLITDLQEKINEVAARRGKKPEFPSIEDYRKGMRFMENDQPKTLSKWIEAAVEIGPETTDEKNRLDQANRALKDFQKREQEKNRSFFEKLNIFKRN
jgi:hypothetical protein